MVDIKTRPSAKRNGGGGGTSEDLARRLAAMDEAVERLEGKLAEVLAAKADAEQLVPNNVREQIAGLYVRAIELRKQMSDFGAAYEPVSDAVVAMGQGVDDAWLPFAEESGLAAVDTLIYEGLGALGSLRWGRSSFRSNPESIWPATAWPIHCNEETGWEWAAAPAASE